MLETAAGVSFAFMGGHTAAVARDGSRNGSPDFGKDAGKKFSAPDLPLRPSDSSRDRSGQRDNPSSGAVAAPTQKDGGTSGGNASSGKTGNSDDKPAADASAVRADAGSAGKNAGNINGNADSKNTADGVGTNSAGNGGQDGSLRPQGSSSKNDSKNDSTGDGKSAGGGDGKSTTNGGQNVSGGNGGKAQDQREPADAPAPPPSTVVEWLERYVFPVPARVQPAAKPPVSPPLPQAQSQSTVAAPQTRNNRAGRRDSPSLSLPVPPTEMLGLKLSRQSLDRVVAMGFKISGKAQVSRLNLGVTRLIPPVGMSIQDAHDFLQQALPGSEFAVNQMYRIYRTATGLSSVSPSDAERPPVAMATPCGTDRCFGASAINWKPHFNECARAVRIGVIDTGYDARHPTFANRAIEARQFIAGGRKKGPDWHGTGILALLAGDTLSATPGLIPDARFYLADIFHADADGQPATDTASLLEALDWLDQKHVNVVNLSLSGPPDEMLKTAIVGLSQLGIMFVAAAGNEGPTAPPTYPAAYGPVIAVTAVNKDLKNYRHANRGEYIDIAAPGVDIWTAMPNGRGGYHSGTSFAVPYVTAVLAAIFSNLPEKTKAAFLKQASVLDLGSKGRNPIYGHGLLQAPATCQPAPGAMVAVNAPTMAAAVASWKVRLIP